MIDGFRGIAIVLVVMYHTWLFSWFTPQVVLLGARVPIDAVVRAGYLGVDLFFAISAFVLFLPWARRAAHGEFAPPQTTRAYAYRRFIKIVPSFYLALAVTLAAAASEHVAYPLGQTLIVHALFLTNSVWSNLGQANSVFWSLGTEVQFYVVFPLLARAFARRPFVVAPTMIAVALAFRWGVSGCCLENEEINRQMPAFADVFCAGMLAAYGVAVAERRFAETLRLRALASALTLGALALGVWLAIGASDVTYAVDGREKWLVVGRSFVAVAAGAALFAACFAARAVRAIVANPATLFLSKISYNLYLWHTLVLLWILKRELLPAATTNPYDDPHWKLAYITLGSTLAIGISTALTYFFERPLLGAVRPQSFAFPWRRIIPRTTVATSEKRT